MLRELDITPITITYTKKQLVEVCFRKGANGVECTATYRVPEADGSIKMVSVSKPIAEVLTNTQANALLDKVVA